MKKTVFAFPKMLLTLVAAFTLAVSLTPVIAYADNAEELGTVVEEQAAQTIEQTESVEADKTAETEDNAKTEELAKTEAEAEEQASEATTAEAEELSDEEAGISLQAEVAPSLVAQAHVQTYGWQTSVNATTGKVASVGTTGESKRLEAIKLKLSEGSILYRTHVQTYGWESAWKTNGELSGTTGQSKRLEAIQIKLSDELASQFDVYYRVHAQTYGWLGWAKNGATAGTAGLSKRLEKLEVVVLPKGTTPEGYDGSSSVKEAQIKWSAHIQTYGAQSGISDSLSDGVTFGTEGKSKRIEAFSLSLPTVDGGISYEAFCQTYGWTGAKANGAVAGTTGQSKRVEAVRMSLTGSAANSYDIWYRTYVANIGWLDWTSNGATAGSKDASKRVEKIQVKVLTKGSAAPGATSVAYLDNSSTGVSLNVMYGTAGSTNYSTVALGKSAGDAGQGKALTGIALSVASSNISGGVSYAAHVQTNGWLSDVSNGAQSQSGSKNVQALKIYLTGNLSKYFDIYYHVYVSGYGWLGWASNGNYAGSTGLSKNIEAYEVKIVVKGASAPGSTANSYSDSKGFLWLYNLSSDQELNNIVKTIINTKTGQGSDALRKAYWYLAGYPYKSGSKYPSGSWESWSIPMAKEMYRNGSGNCYRYASLLAWVARGLGYDAKPIAGTLRLKSGKSMAHSWTEITINGTAYIVDSELATSHGGSNDVYMVTYANAPFYYEK